MLSKKQYWYTLLIAIIVFFVIFTITYLYTKEHSWHIGGQDGMQTTQLEDALPITDIREEIAILPQTQITLKIKDMRTQKQSQMRLESKSLLGLTESELQEQFKAYTIETFNEKEVILVRNYSSEVSKVEDTTIYVLGVDDKYVCIKEKYTNNRPVKIDYEINHFSKYIYSLLLNEEIVITSAQKEALLLNPSTLQKILQGYVAEQ